MINKFIHYISNVSSTASLESVKFQDQILKITTAVLKSFFLPYIFMYAFVLAVWDCSLFPIGIQSLSELLSCLGLRFQTLVIVYKKTIVL